LEITITIAELLNWTNMGMKCWGFHFACPRP